MFKVNRTVMRASRLWSRCYATESSESPPLLLKVRQDLKLAMQNKDSTRLAVLKNILTRTTNASKTEKPIKTDMHMLELLHKSIKEGDKAMKQFKANGRQDLVDNEQMQIKILKEYSAMVKQMSEEELRDTVEGVIDLISKKGQPPKMGPVLKIVFSPKYLADKPVRKEDIVAQVKKSLKAIRKQQDFTIPQPNPVSNSELRSELAKELEPEVPSHDVLEPGPNLESEVSNLESEVMEQDTSDPEKELESNPESESEVPEPEVSIPEKEVDPKTEAGLKQEVSEPEISGLESEPAKQ
ncbi:hypothetical protein K3495_g2457 [Podosphaera aphanis]|nr:hypothetical protein K3495_g2457 [Podosphaera aphanis]